MGTSLDADPGVLAHVGLGSSVEPRLETLHAAVLALDGLSGASVEAVSGVYETAPVGGVTDDAFLNAVVALRTTWAPTVLLAALQAIEAAHGRDRSREQRWGTRTLDLDLLTHGDAVLDTPELVVPHPRLHERAFVLVPFMEVAPGFALPDGRRLAALVADLGPMEGIELHVRPQGWPGSGPARPAGPRGPGALTPEQYAARRPTGGPPPGVER